MFGLRRTYERQEGGSVGLLRRPLLDLLWGEFLGSLCIPSLFGNALSNSASMLLLGCFEGCVELQVFGSVYHKGLCKLYEGKSDGQTGSWLTWSANSHM